MVDGYAAGRSNGSLAYAYRGIEIDPIAQAFGKMGECAVASWFGIDLDGLNWAAAGADRGFDLAVRGKLIDVKATRVGNRYLIWPKTKNEFLPQARFDYLVLTFHDADGSAFELAGFMSRARFIESHETAGIGHVLDSGTFYVSREKLTAVYDFGKLQ